MHDWFHNGSVEIPDDPELEVDLTRPEYGFSSKNQIQLERNEDMKRRGFASPDLGDRLAMTFAVDIAFRSQRTSQLVYQFRSPNAWMGYSRVTKASYALISIQPKVAQYRLRHSPVRALDALWRSPEVGGSAPFGLRLDGKCNIFGKCPKEALPAFIDILR